MRAGGRFAGLPARLAGRAAAVLVGLALVEVGVRAWWSASGQPYRVAEVRAALERRVRDAERSPGAPPREVDPALAAFVGGERFAHPYVGFETVQDDAELAAQLAALRAGRDSLDGLCTVLVLGGSVAEYFADPVNGGLGPVREALGRDARFAGREPVFLAHARAAYKQPQQLMWFAWLLSLGFEPDLVINLDGFNEVALAAVNAERGAHPLYPTLLHWGTVVDPGASGAALAARATGRLAGELAAEVRALGLERSAYAGTLAQVVLRSLDARRAREESRAAEQLATRTPVAGPPFEGSLEEAVELSVHGWESASRALFDLCAARGILYLHVLQPTLHDAGSKVWTEEERARAAAPEAVVRATHHGYPLLRAAGQRLAAAGVPFLDASRVFATVEETVYFDACHFVRPGTVLLGELVAAAL